MSAARTSLRAGWILSVVGAFAGCNGPVTVSDAEREALADYEDAAAGIVAALDDLGEATAALVTRFDEDADDALIDQAIDLQTTRVIELGTAAATLESTEMELAHSYYGGAPIARREGLVQAALFALTVAAFAATMRALSDRMIAARERRDAADESGDVDAALAARREMATLGSQTAQEIVTKVIPNPVERVISAVPIPGVDLSVVFTARDAVQDVTTLVTTDACRVDAESDECRFGGTTADSGTSLEAPAGTLQVVVTGPGLARTVVDVDAPEGTSVILEIDPVEHADLPGEGGSDLVHCRGALGCFDGTSDWVPGECASEGGTLGSGPCP